jgi:exopolysaccharide biosynthesis polyprenyl glycosylphosphotransferase
MLKGRVSATHLFKILFFIIFVIVVNLGYLSSFGIYPVVYPFFPKYIRALLAAPILVATNFKAYITLIPLISVSAFFLANLLEFSRFFRKKNLDIVSQSIKFSMLQTLFTTAVAYFYLQYAFPRSVIILSLPILFVYTSIWTVIGLNISRRLYPTGKIVIIGSSEEEIGSVRSQIESSLKDLDLSVADARLCHDRKAVRSIIRDYDEILICPSVPDEMKSDIILYCARKNTVAYLVPEFYELSLYKSRLINFNDLMVFMLDRLGLTFEQRLVKRIFDLIVSLIAIIVTAPIMLISIVIIMATSKGSPIYRQERVTLDNRKYFIYKLRTMNNDAEILTGPVISGKKDPRVTPFGRFLRRSKLDEVPQFLNVLKGEMSVVGPRSERPVFVEQFQKDIPAYNQRFVVKAGITGLAQVAGSYDTSAEDKLRYDLLYIKNYSILEDIKIVFQTVRAVFTPKLYRKTFQENQDSFCPIPPQTKSE